MNEHPSENMFEEDMIPEGLEYQDAFWELALDKIERKEAAIRVRNWSLGSGLAACIAMLVYFGYLQNTPSDAIALSTQEIVIPVRASGILSQEENASLNAQAESQEIDFHLMSQQSNSHVALDEQESGNMVANQVVTGSENLVSADQTLESKSANAGVTNEYANLQNGENNSVNASHNLQNHEEDALQSMNQNIVGYPSTQENSLTDNLLKNPTESLEKSSIESSENNQVFMDESVQNNNSQELENGIGDSGENFESDDEDFSMFTQQTNQLKLELNQLGLSSIAPVAPKFKYQGNTKQLEGAVIPVNHNKIAFPITPFSLSLNIGSIFRQDYGTLANNPNPQTFISLEGTYSVNRKIFAKTSLGYFAISDIQDVFYSVNNYYTTTAHSDTTAISTHKLQYLTVPVSIGMRIRERHQLSLGVGIDIPIAAKQTLSNSTYQEYAFNTNLQNEEVASPTLENTSKVTNYLQGFRPIQYFTQAEYSYAISSGIRVGFTYKYGLSDITNDEGEHSFVKGDFDRNSYLSGFVKFNIVGK